MHQDIQASPPLFRIARFYLDGFRSMTIGRTLWKIILIKLLIMFGVLKLFFFPDFLATTFSTDEQRADYVLDQLTQPTLGPNTIHKGEQQ
jgi:hypothetical protein